MKVNLFFPTVLLSLIITSCNFSSGTWEDDEKNWSRAFNNTPSDSIETIHSWYWRSPHFTFEHEYFFEFNYSQQVKKLFMQGNDLYQLDSTDFSNIHHFNEKPDWFTPKQYDNYEIWSSYNFPNYYIFIDSLNQTIFLADYSI